MLEILQSLPDDRFFVFNAKGVSTKKTAKGEEENRETLLRFYRYLVDHFGNDANEKLRSTFSQLFQIKKSTLPEIIKEDGFLSLFAEGKAIRINEAKDILLCFEKTKEKKHPIFCDFTENSHEFFDLNASLPGILPKFFPYFRLKSDRKLLERIQIDLKKTAEFCEEKRKIVTFMLLSFFLAYRECRDLEIELPHFKKKGEFVRYKCQQHLIGEGLKTISMIPEKEHPGIYLCQGTEIWPSQPSMLASILNNFAEHGSATQAYAHSWRRIHHQLRELTIFQKPLVMGHSMGGALAMQIALYSHDLIEESFAFNPPMAGERDAQFYVTLPQEAKNKMRVFANLDDVAFWRIGECVIGNVTCYLSKKRWRYYPIYIKDALLFFPAIFKFFWNTKKAFPAHQKIFPLHGGFLFFTLSQEEMQRENRCRKKRVDILHLFPKLYDPLKWLIHVVRKIFKWSLEEEFVRNEIEIIALHERDLIDTITDQNKKQVEEKLEKLSAQKKIMQEKLKILQRGAS